MCMHVPEISPIISQEKTMVTVSKTQNACLVVEQKLESNYSFEIEIILFTLRIRAKNTNSEVLEWL
jgi:hypothetical protein